MNKIKKVGKIIDFKMNKMINGKYKDEILLDEEYRFTTKFFEMTAEVFLELIKDAKNNDK